MGPGTDVWPHCTSLDNGYSRECMPAMIEDEEPDDDLDNVTQPNYAKPPRNGPPVRHSISEALLVDTSNLDKISGPDSPQDLSSASLPAFRSGSCSEIGPKPYMEDEFICVDDLQEHLDAKLDLPLTGAFYGVLTFFKNMIIANAGDSRAVLGKRGRAIELSIDHKPSSTSEKKRIEKLGGVIYDGYLNGQLSVARALGDWHMKGPKGSACPLSAEPELKEVTLTKEDEFLILGCDGLWDVMSSQYAVTIVRKELMVHNDPGKCSRELVSEALKRNSCDNLTVVVVCFSSEPPPKIEVPKSEKRRTISVEGLDVLKGVLHHI
ncbi:Protein phosphatase 2C [Cynara cardunculus var. scolymus]|uniref:Protein phosphatase 2C n=1 Tax=Cynara cardunculus var. scolymus TaxID=59895 RepID=A0A103YGM5_CYNCS|nr:Protein phosphatase 2C [Cynara cardunculus var. scolymus]